MRLFVDLQIAGAFCKQVSIGEKQPFRTLGIYAELA